MALMNCLLAIFCIVRSKQYPNRYLYHKDKKFSEFGHSL